MPATDLATRLLHASLARFAAWSAALDPSLAALLGGVRDAWLQGAPLAARAAEHFVGPRGSPGFVLLAWALESLAGPRQRDRWGAPAGEAMLCWYFAARAQDDRVDEGADRRLAYLEHALVARATHLLAEASGDAAHFLAVNAALVEDFSEASLRDHALRASPSAEWTDDAFALQGRKYHPITACLAAVALRAGHPSLVAHLRARVERLGVGLQLTNDLFGAAHDLATGQRSPYLAALRVAVPSAPEALAPAVRRALRRGDVAAFTARIARSFEEALTAHPALRSKRLARHLDARRAALAAHQVELGLTAMLSGPELVADLEITRRCNLRCPACFVFAQEETGTPLAELSTVLVFELLDELAGYRTHVHLTGGEPFVHRGVWEILARAEALGFDDVLINTNGAYLDDEAARRLGAMRVPVKLLVSIDGPGDTQEVSRGPGMTRAALDAIRRAWAHGVDATPATILTAELVDDGVDAWFDRLAGELPGLARLVLWPLFLRPGAALPPGCGSMLDTGRHHVAARQIAALVRRGLDVTVADYPVLNPLLARAGVPVEKLWQCNAGRGRLSVQADGLVGPCHPFRLALDRVAPGAVAGFVDRTLAHPSYKRLGRRDHDGCATCDDRPICGNCQAVVVGTGHALFSHDGFCRTLGDEGTPDEPARRRLRVVP